MKNLKMTLATLILATASFSTFAATLVDSQPASGEKIGVVTVSNASTLSSLQSQLARKADAAGAKSFQIIEANGDNKLHGTAIIYN